MKTIPLAFSVVCLLAVSGCQEPKETAFQPNKPTYAETVTVYQQQFKDQTNSLGLDKQGDDYEARLERFDQTIRLFMIGLATTKPPTELSKDHAVFIKAVSDYEKRVQRAKNIYSKNPDKAQFKLTKASLVFAKQLDVSTSTINSKLEK